MRRFGWRRRSRSGWPAHRARARHQQTGHGPAHHGSRRGLMTRGETRRKRNGARSCRRSSVSAPGHVGLFDPGNDPSDGGVTPDCAGPHHQAAANHHRTGMDARLQCLQILGGTACLSRRASGARITQLGVTFRAWGSPSSPRGWRSRFACRSPAVWVAQAGCCPAGPWPRPPAPALGPGVLRRGERLWATHYSCSSAASISAAASKSGWVSMAAWGPLIPRGEVDPGGRPWCGKALGERRSLGAEIHSQACERIWNEMLRNDRDRVGRSEWPIWRDRPEPPV